MKEPALRRAVIAVLMALALHGCVSVPEAPRPPVPDTQATGKPRLNPVSWSALPGWRTQSTAAPAWNAFVSGCKVTGRDKRWTQVCEQAATVEPQAAREFFETWFTAYAVTDAAGSTQGLLTGYYEPLLHGSRTRNDRYVHPIYGVPDDLLQVDLSSVYPELAHHRLRGRLTGNKIVPYHSRAAIETGEDMLRGKELLWVDDPVSAFFLQIQGSGRVALEDGSQVRLAYADQNGHPYRAIGKVLVDRGELRREEVTLQSIREWLRLHPANAAEVMQQNPSYVFFDLLPDSPDGPKGAQGVPLTAGHSVAVDPRVIGLGTPVYFETQLPGSQENVTRLAVAQDTGGAIRGAIRADLFLGRGAEAEDLAGRLKQPLKIWVLLPKTFVVSE